MFCDNSNVKIIIYGKKCIHPKGKQETYENKKVSSHHPVFIQMEQASGN